MSGKSKAAPVRPKVPGTQELFMKTKTCKFFELGTCTRGSACVFAHGVAELAQPPDFSRTKLCRELVTTGACSRPDCSFAHSRKELRRRGGQGHAAADRPRPPRPARAAAAAAPDANAMLQAAYASYAMEMGHAAAPARSPSFPSRLAQPPEMPLGPPALQAAWGQPVDWCGSTYAPPRDLDVGPPPGCRAGVPMSVQVQPDFGDPWCGRPIAMEEAPPPPPRPRPAGQPATGPSSGQAAQGGPAWQAQVRAARLPPSEAPPGEFGEVTLRGSAGCFGGGSPGGSSGAQGGPSGCGALGAVARLAPVHEARELHAPPRPASPADLPAHSPLKVSVKNSFLHVGADEEVPCMRMTQTVDCLPLVDLGRMPLSQHIDSQAYSATLETLPDDDGDSVQFGRMGSFSDCLRDPLSVSSITVRNTFIDLPQEGLLAQARQVHTVDYLPSVI